MNDHPQCFVCGLRHQEGEDCDLKVLEALDVADARAPLDNADPLFLSRSLTLPEAYEELEREGFDSDEWEN